MTVQTEKLEVLESRVADTLLFSPLTLSGAQCESDISRLLL